jgi:hypothetical protein
VLCSARLVGHVELKRADESITVLRIVWRMLPRNGGRALSCFARPVTRHAVTSTAGSGTVFPDGRTESGVSVAVPVVRSASLLFRRWLPVSGRHVSGFRKPAAAEVVASLRVHLA